MSTHRTSLTTASGRMIDLLAPRRSDIDFRVIAQHLAKANRYCGATPDVTYSVAEHSVRAARASYVASDEPGMAQLPAYLLCHDMHEAYLGDDTTPKKRALEALAEREFGVLAGAIRSAFFRLTDEFDAAIHDAAGLSWPPTPEIASAVKHWDTVMLATEWRDLMKCPPPYNFAVQPHDANILPLRWQAACDLFITHCYQLLPALQPQPAVTS